MHAPLVRLTCLLSLLLIATSASAVTVVWTPIGNLGNACNPQGTAGTGGCLGGVSYAYSISTYDVTNAQYVEFLNAKAASDPLALYNTNMTSDTNNGGIMRTGTSGSYSYSAIATRENWPVVYVSFYDAVRFANWMNNGQGNADTETGAYTLQGGTVTPSNGSTVTRNADAQILLPNQNEWYKAAYHDAVGLASTDYFAYPQGSSTQPNCTAPTATPNSANCGNAVDHPTAVGSYTGSPSPYGTFDQGGNVNQWTETIHPVLLPGGIQSSARLDMAGNWGNAPSSESSGSASADNESTELPVIGFRLVMITPEPSTGLLVIAGLLGLAGWRRTRACY